MLIGGHNSGWYSNKVFLYDWTSNSWSNLAPLIEARSRSGCAVLEGQGVLVVGGWSGNDLQSVELFDFQSNTWVQQPAVPQSIKAADPVIMLHEDTVVGVFNDNDKVYKRAADGSWAPIEYITLPSAFRDNRYDNAFLVDNTFNVNNCN